MSTDKYINQQERKNNPVDFHAAVTPSDSVELDPIPNALYCSADGDVVVKDAAGTSITYALVAGDVLPVRARYVMATGTTGTVKAWF